MGIFYQFIGKYSIRELLRYVALIVVKSNQLLPINWNYKDDIIWKINGIIFLFLSVSITNNNLMSVL